MMSPRITRVYLYHWNSTSKLDSWDSALIGPNGKRRPAYTVLQNRLKALRAEYTESGKANLFDALKGTLTGDATGYRELGARLGLSEGDLRSLVASPIEFTGAAGVQVREVVKQIDALVAAHPEAATYVPRAIL